MIVDNTELLLSGQEEEATNDKGRQTEVIIEEI